MDRLGMAGRLASTSSSTKRGKLFEYFGEPLRLYEITTASRDEDYDVNASGYYRLPADSYAAINMGKQKVTPACCNFGSDVCADWRGDSLL